MSPSDSMDNKSSQTHSWELLAEFLLPDGIANEHQDLENASIQIIEAVGDLGLAPVQLNRIKGTLVNAKRNVIRNNTQKGSNLPIAIRLYYQKKKSEQPDEVETLGVDFDALCLDEDGVEPSEVRWKTFRAETGDTGWGYFLTERRVEAYSTSLGEPTYLIELFLYTEEK